MATLVLTDARVEINAVVLSDHVAQVTVEYTAEMKDETRMGDTTRRPKPGLKDWSLDVLFHQDFAAALVDATLFPLVGAAAFPIKVRPTSAAISATNPEYQGNAVLESYPPVAGTVGDMLQARCRFRGVGALTRATV